MASIYKYPVRTVPGKQNRPIRTRWHVRMELGRGKVKHLGVFPTKKLADDKIQASWEILNRGGMPVKTPLSTEPVATRTFSELAAAWLATRIDVSESTYGNFEGSLKHLNGEWGTRDPATISVADLQAWIAKSTALPGTLRLRLGHLSQILEYGDIEPNPVKSPKLRKPRRTRGQYWLPNRRELAAMYSHLTDKAAKNLPVALIMEHGGLRISEAVNLTWGDIQQKRGYILVRGTKTNAGERKVYPVNGLPVLPGMPDGARLDARVYGDVTIKSVPAALRRASEQAGLPNINPHRLRHLCASRLMHDAHLDPASIAARMGHSTPQMTLSTYTHMVPPEEG
jgi:integrase